MSNAKKCDRCGKYFEPYSTLISIKKFDRYKFDLCPKCMKAFVRWLNKKQQVIEVKWEDE